MSESNQLKTFLIEIAVCLIFVIDLGALILVISRDPSSYGAATIEKMQRLAEAPSPRIIFEGGSGIAFGMDSAAVQEKTGLNPVNLGLYAGFGQDFMDAQAASGAHPGDIVMIMPEYDVIDAPPSAQGFLMLEALQEDPTLIRFAWSNPYSLIDIIRQFPGWFSTRVVSLIGKTPLGKYFVQEDSLYHRVYRASSFNVYGDMVGHLNEPYRLGVAAVASSTLLSGDKPDPNVLMSLKNFVTAETNKGVTVLVSWPAVPKSLYEKNKQDLLAQDALVAQAVGNERILGTQADFVFDDGDFFDSINHLNGVARELRTETLIKLLQSKLQN